MEQNERLKLVIDSLCGGSQARFASAVSIERSMLNKMVKGIYPVTEKTILRITSRYPSINPDYLRGRSDDAGDLVLRPTISKDDIIKAKDEEIAYLRKSIDLLERLVQTIETK